MSAYVVSADTINFIVSKASELRASYYFNDSRTEVRGNEQTFVDILYAANIASVNARYNEHSTGRIKFVRYTKPQTALDLLKCIDCLDYQCNEVDDYEKTIGFTVMRDIKDCAIRALPGYDDAAWGV